MSIEEEESEIIKRYHKNVKDMIESGNINTNLIKPEKFNINDESCRSWLVQTVLSIQDEIRNGNEN